MKNSSFLVHQQMPSLSSVPVDVGCPDYTEVTAEDLELYLNDPMTDRIGGDPVLLDSESPLPLSVCPLCSSHFALIAQIQTLIHTDSRILYIFVCSSIISGPNKQEQRPLKCSSDPKGWLVIRSKKIAKSESKNMAKPATIPVSPLFSKLAFEPSRTLPKSSQMALTFGASKPIEMKNMTDLLKKRNDMYEKKNPLRTQVDPTVKVTSLDDKLPDVESLKLTRDEEKLDSIAPKFPVHFIFFTKDKVAVNLKGKDKKDSTEHPSVTESDPQWQESYEKMRIKGVTKAFKNFQKAVERFPDQCIRYSFGGCPLFFADDQTKTELLEGKLPPCSNCGAPRTFECQLMPNIHRLLSKAHQEQAQGAPRSILEHISTEVDWGTILIYTCSRDCDPGNEGGIVYHAIEYVAVQIEAE